MYHNLYVYASLRRKKIEGHEKARNAAKVLSLRTIDVLRHPCECLDAMGLRGAWLSRDVLTMRDSRFMLPCQVSRSTILSLNEI